MTTLNEKVTAAEDCGVLSARQRGGGVLASPRSEPTASNRSGQSSDRRDEGCTAGPSSNRQASAKTSPRGIWILGEVLRQLEEDTDRWPSSGDDPSWDSVPEGCSAPTSEFFSSGGSRSEDEGEPEFPSHYAPERLRGDSDGNEEMPLAPPSPVTILHSPEDGRPGASGMTLGAVGGVPDAEAGPSGLSARPPSPMPSPPRDRTATKRKRSRGRPRKDGSGPLRSPSIASDASIETRIRGIPMEGFRARRILRSDDESESGEDLRPLRRVHIPASTFFTPSQRRDVDQMIAALGRSSTTDVASMAEGWLIEVERARARGAGSMKGEVAGKIKVSTHLAREALLLLANRAMGRSSEVARDPDEAALREQRHEALLSDYKKLRSDFLQLKRELNTLRSANAFLRKRRDGDALLGVEHRVPAETGAETGVGASRPPSPVPAAGDPNILCALAEISASIGGLSERLIRLERAEPSGSPGGPSRRAGRMSPLEAAPAPLGLIGKPSQRAPPSAGEEAVASEPLWEVVPGRKRRKRAKVAKAAQPGPVKGPKARARKATFAAVAAGRELACPGTGRPAAATRDYKAEKAQPTPGPSRASVAAPSGPSDPPPDKVGKKGRKRRKRGEGVPSSSAPKSVPPPRASKAKRRSRGAGTAAVAIGVTAGRSLADVLREARDAISLEELGIGPGGLRPRRTAAGGLLLEIPGKEAGSLADKLFDRLSTLFAGDRGVAVSRPRRSTELRLSGFDESVTPADVRATLVARGCCDPEQIRVGTVRFTRRGLGSIWVRCPSAAVSRIVGDERPLVLGWARTRVEVLRAPPLRCYRCLAQGHVQQRCPAPREWARCCFNCGGEGHPAAGCKGRPHCPPCAWRGLLADHRPGIGPRCRPWPPRKSFLGTGGAGAQSPGADDGAGGSAEGRGVGITPSPVSSTESPEVKRARVVARRAALAPTRELSVVIERVAAEVPPAEAPPPLPQRERDPRLRRRKERECPGSTDPQGDQGPE